MDRSAFSKYLRGRKCDDAQISRSLDLIERFEDFRGQGGHANTKAALRAFVDVLVDEHADTYENLLALLRYGRFSGENDIYVEILALLDGSEVMHNLYERLAGVAGAEIRDQVFEGLELPNLGLGSIAKARLMGEVIRRLEAALTEEMLTALLSPSLRDMPDSWFADGKTKFQETWDIEEYLRQTGEQFVEHLQSIKESNGLFFNQPITDEVIEFVRGNQEIASGVLRDNVIYVTKIPYMAKEYLAETDSVKQRYYYCHCPWARESILGGAPVPVSFCHCSAGFVKRQWEVNLGQTLKAEVLESALKGDQRCRFAIHLP